MDFLKYNDTHGLVYYQYLPIWHDDAIWHTFHVPKVTTLTDSAETRTHGLPIVNPPINVAWHSGLLVLRLDCIRTLFHHWWFLFSGHWSVRRRLCSVWRSSWWSWRYSRQTRMKTRRSLSAPPSSITLTLEFPLHGQCFFATFMNLMHCANIH